jgi:hypothetical protein
MAIEFKDCSQILATALKGVTGQEQNAALNTAEFVSQAQTALLTGVDPIMQSISQVLAKTIFSVRPYNAKFGSLMVDNIVYGNHVRKITPIDDAPEVDQRGMTDSNNFTAGQEMTPYTWKPDKVLQTNFYGGKVYQRSKMFTRDQVYSAFQSPEEFGNFISMIMTNASNMIEQDKETMARMAICNYIGGKIKGSTADVIHVLTEYNAATGLELTATDVYKPDNFVPFVRWLYARVATLSDLMTERTINYHTNITDKLIMRHTPKVDQRMYLYSPLQNQMRSMVLSDTYHDNLLDMGVSETVNFWQNVDRPNAINVTPSYINASGEVVTADAPVTNSNIIGVIIDRETVGETLFGEWSGTTPMDMKHGITNMYWHYTLRFWNDFTENGIILTMD